MQDLETIIIDHPFWQNLQQRYSHFLGECAGFQHFAAQEEIFRTGWDADHFYLIERGRVALETPFIPGKGVITIETLEAGEALGWSWLFPPYVWDFGAIAIERSDLVVFDAEFLRNKASEDHEFGFELAMRVGGVMLQRLQATRLQLLDYGQPR
jgi:CRP/FNR family cyclic AMP-dependent transcriptional regulator